MEATTIPLTSGLPASLTTTMWWDAERGDHQHHAHGPTTSDVPYPYEVAGTWPALVLELQRWASRSVQTRVSTPQLGLGEFAGGLKSNATMVARTALMLDFDKGATAEHIDRAVAWANDLGLAHICQRRDKTDGEIRFRLIVPLVRDTEIATFHGRALTMLDEVARVVGCGAILDRAPATASQTTYTYAQIVGPEKPTGPVQEISVALEGRALDLRGLKSAHGPKHAPRKAAASAVPVTPITIDLATLRQHLADTAKGKRGDAWVTMRHASKGERMISIDGGPTGAPLIHGVDEFLSQRLIFALASAEIDGFAWYQVAPKEAAQLFEPSMAILREDVHRLGGLSRWTVEHFAGKWQHAAEKVAGQVAEAANSMFALTTARQEAAECIEQGIPLIVQVDNAFFVLDDRARQVYEGPMTPSVVRGICSQVWGTARPLVTEDAKGNLRPMDAIEIREAYGKACMRLVTEYTATGPRVDDLALVNCLARPPIEPEQDDAVAHWLEVFGGEQHEMLLDWITWAAPERCNASTPALALVGGSHVGKGLLAESLAKCVGQVTASSLKAVLGQFRYLLNAGPVVFGDEGLPSAPGAGNKPATEEFRALVTTTDHLIEMKGLDKRLLVRGGVRCILAANRADRLFSNTGHLSNHDVSAITRRLCVIDIEGEEKIEELKALSGALGAYEHDPARAIRVARHMRWLQLNRKCKPPEPCSGSIDRALRMGGDMAATALSALEDATGEVDWITIDEPNGVLWVQADPFVLRVEAKSAGAVWRALASYVKHKSDQRRTHPVTGATLDRRMRWTGFDLTRLRADGIGV